MKFNFVYISTHTETETELKKINLIWVKMFLSTIFEPFQRKELFKSFSLPFSNFRVRKMD